MNAKQILSRAHSEKRLFRTKRAILLTLAAGFFGLGPFCQHAQAAQIQGDIDFGGVVTYDTMSLATATRVDLWNSAFVLQVTGDYTSFVSPGANPTMSAWIFSPSTPTPALWSVGGFTFDLSSSVILSQSSQFLDIQGFGTITGNGFDPTPGVWTFTSSRSDGADHNTFGFQSQTSPIPEPSSMALLAVAGLVVIVGIFVRRERRLS